MPQGFLALVGGKVKQMMGIATSAGATDAGKIAFAIDRQGVKRLSAIDASVLVNQTTNINPE